MPLQPYHIRVLTILCSLLLLTGCGDWSYYSQSISGHLEMMQKRVPVQEILDHPETPAGLRAQLHQSQHIRQFASSTLHLPKNGSYTSYVDLDRPYVVWNVVAASEFSLSPVRWCYPLVGCLPYRGFYRRSDAHRLAGELRDQGYDVTVYGVPAYSTLNWFDDPVLNTFVASPPTQLASLIFHELAHQVIYIPDDAPFNEAFAVSVELEGTLRYIESFSSDEEKAHYLGRRLRNQEFIDLLFRVRTQLQELYNANYPFREKRARKHLLIRRFHQDYRQFQTRWGGFTGYNRWVRQGVNNARLASISTYHDRVAGFRTLFLQEGQKFPRFYKAVQRLAQLPKPQRHAILTRLSGPDSPHWSQLLPPATR